MATPRASDELRADREVILAAVQHDGCMLKHASAELRADREVVLAAVQNNGQALVEAQRKLHADREVVLAAVETYPSAFRYASAELRTDVDVVLAALRVNAAVVEHVPPRVLDAFPLLRAAAPCSSAEAVRAAIAASRAALERDVERWTEAAAIVARHLPEDLVHEVEAAMVAPLRRPDGAYAATLKRTHDRMEAGC